MRIQIDIKPLSINRAFKGRRFKTKDYEDYEKEVLLLLPKCDKIKGEVAVYLEFYLKNAKRIDVDNLEKLLLDIIVKKGYIEDDRKIWILQARKFISKVDYIIIEITKI